MNPLLIRRRGMMLQQREPLVLLYEASNVKTTTDTNIKLFDPAISFTILVDATWNNFNTVSNNSGIIGLSTNTLKFRIGGISSGNDYTNGVLSATANRYVAGMLNYDTAERKCIAIGSKGTNAATRKKNAVCYDKATKKFLGIGAGVLSGTKWYTLDQDVSIGYTVQLFVGGMTGTIHNVKIYQGAMTLQEMRNWYDNA